jgi:hypothetical protein
VSNVWPWPALVVADDRRVLEVLGADAAMTCGCARSAGLQAPAQLVGQRDLAERQPDAVARRPSAGMKFIAGEPMKPATKRSDRVVVQRLGRVDLLQHAQAHDRDAVAERQRLGLVVGDVDGRRVRALLDARDLGAGLHAQLRVEVRRAARPSGTPSDRARSRGPSRRAGAGRREVAGLRFQVLGEVEDRAASSTLRSISPLSTLRELEREAHVLAHRHVRVQRVFWKTIAMSRSIGAWR